MKYPKLSDKQDLRRKLMDKDITFLKVSHAKDYPFKGTSYRQWAMGKASVLGVSPATIYYHTDASYQSKMKAKNAKAHSKEKDLEDYEHNRAKEIQLRMNRWARNPALREWHYIVSAKNEKRSQRKTVLGKTLLQ